MSDPKDDGGDLTEHRTVPIFRDNPTSSGDKDDTRITHDAPDQVKKPWGKNELSGDGEEVDTGEDEHARSHREELDAWQKRQQELLRLRTAELKNEVEEDALEDAEDEGDEDGDDEEELEQARLQQEEAAVWLKRQQELMCLRLGEFTGEAEDMANYKKKDDEGTVEYLDRIASECCDFSDVHNGRGGYGDDWYGEKDNSR